MKEFPFNMYYPKGFNHDLTIEDLYLSYVNDFLTVDAWKKHHYLTDTMVKFIFTQYQPMKGSNNG
jgi:hypothetical protein